MIGEERDSGVPVIGVLLPNRILLRVMSMTEELLALLAKHTFSSHEQTPFHTALPSVTLVRASNGRYPRYILHRPALCMVLQGTKRTVFGDIPFDYSAGQALVVTTTMPGVSRIIEADALHPYLGIIVEFDMVILRDVFIQLSQRPIQKMNHLMRPLWSIPMSLFIVACFEDCVYSIRLMRSLYCIRDLCRSCVIGC